jgi:hydrogenase nickel incorporation protein HypB
MHEIADDHTVESILSNNQHIALHNREDFDESRVFAVNLMSAPGAGKTSLLEATIPKLGVEKCFVVEGDMVGQLDADRLRNQGIHAIQISTGRSCHLTAQMVARIIDNKELFSARDYLFVENVGNLVCPAEFPLGEHKRVVLLSVTEGADKPLKYPLIFRNCDAVVFSKCDLLPYVDFNLHEATEFVHNINPDIRTFALSTKTNEGVGDWLDWLRTERQSTMAGIQEDVFIHSR